MTPTKRLRQRKEPIRMNTMKKMEACGVLYSLGPFSIVVMS